MLDLLIWFLFGYSVSNILVFGSNFQWWRNLLKNFGTGPLSLYKLFTCMMCLPTWVGFVMSYLIQKYTSLDTIATIYGIEQFWVAILIDGILTSGGVWLIHTFQEFLERVFSNE